MTKENTMDVTKAIERHYPVLKDLLTEDQFQQFLCESGIFVSKLSLRDYRYRDKHYAYIKKGNAVFYPIHVNRRIVADILKDNEYPEKNYVERRKGNANYAQ